MLVGEAPGKREDDLEKPFQGKSGQLLDKILLTHGLTRQHVYITNICRCRPKDNRKPVHTEAEACEKYLVQELSIIQPRVVVTLGGTALRAMTGFGKVSVFRGRPIFPKSWGLMIIPTWHPSYCIRNGGEQQLAKYLETGKRKVEWSVFQLMDDIGLAVEGLGTKIPWNVRRKRCGSSRTV